MSRSRITALAIAAALGLTAVFAASASASYHLVKIREVHKGTAITGDYAMLQMYEPGQNFFAGRYLRFFDGTGMVLADYALKNVPNGQGQRTYLLGNIGVVGADDNQAGVQITPSGAVCFNEFALNVGGIDCVSWGAFTPTAGNVSSPSQPNFGSALAPNQSLVRKIKRGCPFALDPADDKNNSAADFAIGKPIGRGNAAVPIEKGKRVISGGPGKDKLRGTKKGDVLLGLGGNDKIKGRGGNDKVCGGGGKDQIAGGKGKDVLRGEAGKDTLLGGPGKDKLIGGKGSDLLKGGPGKDKLKGGKGKDKQIQ